MPLDFLKRKNTGDTAASTEAVTAAPTRSVTLPEEVVAQDFQLKLYYAGKSSEGVRFRAGAQAIDDLPRLLDGIARNDVEVNDLLIPAHMIITAKDLLGGEFAGRVDRLCQGQSRARLRHLRRGCSRCSAACGGRRSAASLAAFSAASRSAFSTAAEGTDGIDPADVLVTTGGQQVIDLVCKTLIDPGDVIVAEALEKRRIGDVAASRERSNRILADAEAAGEGGLGVARLAERTGREPSQVSRALSRLAEVGSGLLLATLDAIESGQAHAVPQVGEASRAPIR